MTMIDDQDGWTAKLNLYYSPPNTHIYNNMYTHTDYNLLFCEYVSKLLDGYPGLCVRVCGGGCRLVHDFKQVLRLAERKKRILLASTLPPARLV